MKLGKDKNEINKTIYDSDIIQGLFERIYMLEQRIEKLEGR